MASVRLDNLCKNFGAVRAVDGVSLEIPDGELMVLVGPSGCGKSTLLRLVAGLEEATSGGIFLDDREVSRVKPQDRDVAMVFQNYALFPHLNVEQNMAFSLKFRKVAKPEIRSRVAEAAKVIENSQRDINIAFVNELSKIFRLLDIDTQAVLEAAATKWNFIKFTPGLVGGHCIGVDPYYLAQKAQEEGYNPEIILAGRRMNDGMGSYVAQEVVKLMIQKECKVKNGHLLMLGITFKENCPDIRNSKVIDVIEELRKYNLHIDVYDPWANATDVYNQFGLHLLTEPSQLKANYEAVVLAVGHNEFGEFNLEKHLASPSVVFDVKGFLPKEKVDGCL